MYNNYLRKVHIIQPLVHCITNYVSINDCANILLACGAHPIMAEDAHEVAEITSRCDALVINMGMLTDAKLEAMLIAGRTANSLNHPVILDPVGVGASAYRKEAAARLLSEIHFSVIRGNISEIKTLANIEVSTSKGMHSDTGLSREDKPDSTISFSNSMHDLTSSSHGDKSDSTTSSKGIHDITGFSHEGKPDNTASSSYGVEASHADKVDSANLQQTVDFAKAFARAFNCVVAITGETDIVADSTDARIVKNGHPMMSSVTGTGCQLSALTAAFVAANSECFPDAANHENVSACVSECVSECTKLKSNLDAVTAAVTAMGVCGEIAHDRMTDKDGNTSYRNYIIDAIYNLSSQAI